MTTEQLAAIDKLVDEHVFGVRGIAVHCRHIDWVDEPKCESRPNAKKGKRIREYTAHIAAAWLVVEKMRERGIGVNIDDCGFDGEEWRCVFSDRASVCGIGETISAPLAICLAALHALDVEVPT